MSYPKSFVLVTVEIGWPKNFVASGSKDKQSNDPDNLDYSLSVQCNNADELS